MKIVYISPHLSTGGCPQFLLKKIQLLHKDHDVYCIEYSDHGGFVVQKNQIKEILKDKFYSVNYKKEELLDIIDRINPDVVHLEEMPEYFLDGKIGTKLYKKDRKYKIVETSHDSSFDPKNKVFFPDHFTFVSQYQKELQKSLEIPSDVCEYPITINPRKKKEDALRVLNLDPNKKHVINVGLFTPRKNQAEIIEYAKALISYPIQFHFIGNHADNFKFYWEPIMKSFPSNCTWWNERKDVENFYQAADLFLFTSRGTVHDKETSPLVIREAISYNLTSLIYNLPVYMGMYDKYENISYLNFDSIQDNCVKILNALKIKPTEIMTELIQREENIQISYDPSDNKINYTTNYNIPNAVVSVKDIDSKTVLYAAQHEVMHAGINFWIIPVPKAYRDFETDPFFGGMVVEVYSGDDLVYSKEFRIKPINVEKPILKTKNHITPTYNNYMEFFVHGEYDEYLKGKQFDVVVDVGANAGIWTEYIKHATKYKKIYAIEPNLQALQTLRKTYSPDEITIVDKALCDKDGELEFFVDPSNSTIGSIHKNHQASLVVSHKVQGISFRTFLKEYNLNHIDLFKMDIEGGEYPFFASMEKEDLDKIGMMLIEFHMQAGQTMDKEVAILMALFRGAGFKCAIKSPHAGGGFIIATR